MAPELNVAVVGAGTMGAGIAQLAACNDSRVYLIDVSQDVVDGAMRNIAARLESSVKKGKRTAEQRDAILERIIPKTAIEDLGDVQLAIEAVVEKQSVKEAVFSALQQATPATAVLATNTSSLSVSSIAEPLKAPGRVIGMHFFNPAPVMPLVEVIAGAKSEPAAVDIGVDAARRWGKTPVRVKDTPGFIVNRVARGFYLEALRLLDEGVAGVSEIDTIVQSHAGFRMGPFTLMDLIGIDVNYAVSMSVYEQLGQPERLRPHPIQKALVGQGNLGKKTGSGFYHYDEHGAVPGVTTERRSFDLPPMLKDVLQQFCLRGELGEATPTEQLVLTRILSAIMNEAGLARSEEVASAADIDIAMQKGTSYPRGPLAWAEMVGFRTVRGVLKAFDNLYGDGRYAPAPLYENA